jgi:hypothetical protein
MYTCDKGVVVGTILVFITWVVAMSTNARAHTMEWHDSHACVSFPVLDSSKL